MCIVKNIFINQKQTTQFIFISATFGIVVVIAFEKIFKVT